MIGFTDPYDINIDDDEEVIRCVNRDVNTHFIYQHWPMWCVWDRFIPGRPNRMRMKVAVDNWYGSDPKLRGARLEIRDDFVWVDVFTAEYPKVLLADFSNIEIPDNYTVSLLERDLPEGIQLAPFYKKNDKILYRLNDTVKTMMYKSWEENTFDPTRILDVDRTTFGLSLKPQQEIVKKDDNPDNAYLPKAEEERIRKVAQLLGKDYEEVRRDIVVGRQKREKEKQEYEAKLVKKFRDSKPSTKK